MERLKELVDKIYVDLQDTDWIVQYPELSEKSILSEYIQESALEIMPWFVSKDKLEEFMDACDENFNESTFKKYIENYPEFLNSVEQEFYNWLLMWLAES